MDLTEFLDARLDEDEAAAQAWTEPPWREDATHWQHVGKRNVRYDNQRGEDFQVIDVSGRPLNWSEAIQVRWDSNGERVAHIVRHHPARVLREVAAKRAIVARHERARVGMNDQSLAPDVRWEREAIADEIEQNLRSIAAVYSDHPDYRDEWKP